MSNNILGDAYTENMTSDDVLKVLNPFNIETMKFMCSQCLVSTIPQSTDGLKESVFRSSVSTGVENPESSDNIAPDSPRVGEGNVKSNSNDDITLNNHSAPAAISEEICKNYVNGQCPHGMSGKTLYKGEVCRFTHPKRCRKYCTYGPHSEFGCNSKDCEYFHPTLCKYSVQNHLCTNLNCKFVHLKHTQRYATNNSFNNHHAHSNASRTNGLIIKILVVPINHTEHNVPHSTFGEWADTTQGYRDQSQYTSMYSTLQ